MLLYYKARLFYILEAKHICLQYRTQEFTGKCNSTIKFYTLLYAEKNIAFELNVWRKKYFLKELGWCYKKDQDLSYIWIDTVKRSIIFMKCS